MAKKAKPKKRGVKPGTKRGSYRKPKNKITTEMDKFLKEVKGWQVVEDESKLKASYTPKTLTLCEQLEDAVMNLETRISNSIAKINSLM